MKADLTRVPFQSEELSAVKAVTDIVDEVFRQAGPDDEEPGVDADDIGQILIKAFGPGTAAASYITNGGTPRGMIARAKNIFYGVERAYDLVGTAGVPPPE